MKTSLLLHKTSRISSVTVSTRYKFLQPFPNKWFHCFVVTTVLNWASQTHTGRADTALWHWISSELQEPRFDGNVSHNLVELMRCARTCRRIRTEREINYTNLFVCEASSMGTTNRTWIDDTGLTLISVSAYHVNETSIRTIIGSLWVEPERFIQSFNDTDSTLRDSVMGTITRLCHQLCVEATVLWDEVK